MFSFFKKSKKEGDTSSGRENKDKKSKERELKPDHYNTAIPTSRLTKDMCKNKSDYKSENAPSGGTYLGAENGPEDIAFPPLTSDNLVIDNESKTNETVYQKPEESEHKTYPSPQQEDLPSIITEPMFSFFTKRSPDSGQTHNVKPCGHGTVGISPRIPPQAIETPPESPKLDISRRKSKDLIEECNGDSTNETTNVPIKKVQSIKPEDLNKRKNGDVSPPEQFFDANFNEDDV